MVASFKSPGVLVREQVRGAIPASIASHSDIYLFGTANTAGAVFNEPQPISTVDQFSTLYNFANPNRVYVEAIFANHPSASLNFIPVRVFRRYLVTVGTVTTDDVFSITIENDAFTKTLTVTAIPDDTVSTIVNKLLNLLANDLEVIPFIKVQNASEDDEFYVIELDSDTTVESANADLAITVFSAGIQPIVNDFVDSIQETLTEDNNYASGFIIVPQAYKAFPTPLDRATLINSIEAVAVACNCVSIVDAPQNLVTPNSLLNERKLYGSPKGHSSYFAPWLLFNDGIETVEIPPSPVVAAVWAKYIRDYGLSKSPLGIQSALAIAGVKTTFKKADSDFVNLEGVNLIRNISKAGFVIWGGRTMSIDSRYNFCSGRVVMNSINETCESAFIPFIGQIIAVQGGTFHDLRNTGDSILFRYWNNNDLYGENAEDAYLVVCDSSNNFPADLDQGLVKVDLYAVTSPTLERVLVTTIKVPIGQIGALG